MKNKKVLVIEWLDSYGAMSGWIDLDGYEPKELKCVSCGFKVYENKKVIAIAPNIANATTYTPNQANGVMVIPKSCIVKTTSYSIS